MWDEGQYRIFGVDPADLRGDTGQRPGAAPSGRCRRAAQGDGPVRQGRRHHTRPNSASCGRTARSAGASARRRRRIDKGGRVVRVSGVTVDITERKQAEERQNLLAREVDHRAKNALALAQSIVRLTRGENVKAYVQSVEGRINALARVHTVLSLSSWQGAEIRKLVDEELAPYSTGDQIALSGPEVQLQPATAQTAGAGAARTRHQFGEVWRAVDAVGPAVGELGRSRRTFSRSGWKRPAGRWSRSRHRAGSEREA